MASGERVRQPVTPVTGRSWRRNHSTPAAEPMASPAANSTVATVPAKAGDLRSDEVSSW